MSALISIPIDPKGKARPRVVRRKGKVMTFMPTDYVSWKKKMAVLLLPFKKEHDLPMMGELSVDTSFCTKTGNTHSDLDNAHGAVLDALQDAGWIANDKQVKRGSYSISKGQTMLALTIERIPGSYL